MNTSQRHRIFVPVVGLILLGIALGLLIPSPALADVGVQPILPGGSSIEPEGETPVQMAAEVVTMDVRAATADDNAIIQLNPAAYGLDVQSIWYSVVAEVQADFTMRNPTTEAVTLTAWFPLASTLDSVSWELNPDEIVPRIASFKVAVGSSPVEYIVSELPNPKGADKLPLPWASFPVTFPAGAETLIHVSYLLPLTQAVKGSELALYYVFQTGAGWDGPIGQAELIINLPYPASAGTLVRVPPGNFNIPYSFPVSHPGLPVDGVMEGNQARWTWTNFEPSAQDDFSAWLVDPGLWQELEAAQDGVLPNQNNGQAWLRLATVYRNLSIKGYNFPSIFADSYISFGLEAYQKAADLLPEHPAPHTGLAMLTLAPYMLEPNAPPEVMQLVQDELKIAKDLEISHPELAEEGGISSWLLDEALSIYYGNVTATAESAASSTAQAQQTEAAALLLTPSLTPTLAPAVPQTPIPSPSPKSSLPTAVATAATESENALGTGQNIIIIVAAVVVVVIIAVIQVWRRSSRRP